MCIEFERQTFERLWAESGKDSEEGHHLMRTSQKQYYEDDIVGKTQLEHMPDVRSIHHNPVVVDLSLISSVL